MIRAWLIRAGRSGEREQWALTSSVSGGGFGEVDDLSTANSREAVLQRVAAANHGESEGRIQNFAAQLWALRSRMETGDLVVMPLKSAPRIAIGRVSGEYQYLAEPENDKRHVRPVKWLTTDVPRTVIHQDLLYSLGAFLTICEVRRNDAAHRLSVIAKGKGDPGARVTPKPAPGDPAKPFSPQDDLEDNEVSDPGGAPINIEEYAFDRLTTHIIQTFAGHYMQKLVAAVLEAEGFTCKVPPEGPDQGVDVLAGSGPLGLDEPHLIVQVKSEAGSVGAPVVQQLRGAMSHHNAKQGLLVAWGGLTKQAENMLANQHFSIRVWSSKELLDAVIRNYDALPEEIRNDLPLKPVWALVERQD